MTSLRVSERWPPRAGVQAYQRALQLTPRHRGAHEYLGDAYLIANDLANAEKHLTALEKTCLMPCEKYDDLKNAIAA